MHVLLLILGPHVAWTGRQLLSWSHLNLAYPKQNSLRSPVAALFETSNREENGY